MKSNNITLNVPILITPKSHYPYPKHPPSEITKYSHKIHIQAHPTLLNAKLEVNEIILVDDYTEVKYTITSIKGGISNPIVELDVSGSAKKQSEWFKLENGNV